MAEYYIDKKTGAVVDQERLVRWKKQLAKADYLIVQARTGAGKTTMVKIFANKEFPDYFYVSCTENWQKKIRDIISRNQAADKMLPFLIVADDFQEMDLSGTRLYDAADFLNTLGRNIKVLFVSRGAFPRALGELLAKPVACAARDFGLNLEQTRMLMCSRGLTPTEEMVETCLAKAEGEARFTNVWINYMCAGLEDADEIYRRSCQDYWEQWDKLFQDTRLLLMFQDMTHLSVFDYLTIERTEALLGEEKARKFFHMAASGTSSLEYEEDGTIHTHWFFIAYLRCHFQRLPVEVQREDYERAAECYEAEGNMIEAIRCYEGAGKEEKAFELTCHLAEGIDGSYLVREENGYMDRLSRERIRSNVYLMAAKAVLAACRLHMDECQSWKGAVREYVQLHPDNLRSKCCLKRLQMVLPDNHADHFFNLLQEWADEFGTGNAGVQGIAPSGGMPGVLNGRIDFCSLLVDRQGSCRRLQELAVPVLGREAEGWTEIFQGEAEYQKNERTSAVAHLTQGLSNANLKGTPGMQYAAIGIMSDAFMTEGQFETALSILRNFYEKVKKTRCMELQRNVRCSIALVRLKKGDQDAARECRNMAAELDDKEVFISDRYVMYAAAVSALALGREAEALYRMKILQNLTERYHYDYLRWKVQLLTAVIYQRRGESWEKILVSTVEELKRYDMVRLLADEGAALLPLWRKVNWDQTPLASEKIFLNQVDRAIREYAQLYPDYLNQAGGKRPLTRQEKKVLAWMAEGMTNAQIAAEMGLSVSTVKKYVAFIFEKLQVDNRAGAVKTGYQYKLL